jgi:hypothetical protein
MITLRRRDFIRVSPARYTIAIQSGIREYLQPVSCFEFFQQSWTLTIPELKHLTLGLDFKAETAIIISYVQPIYLPGRQKLLNRILCSARMQCDMESQFFTDFTEFCDFFKHTCIFHDFILPLKF